MRRVTLEGTVIRDFKSREVLEGKAFNNPFKISFEVRRSQSNMESLVDHISRYESGEANAYSISSFESERVVNGTLASYAVQLYQINK